MKKKFFNLDHIILDILESNKIEMINNFEYLISNDLLFVANCCYNIDILEKAKNYKL